MCSFLSLIEKAIRYCGSPQFGGLSALRELEDPKLAGTHGVQLNFLVKRTKRIQEVERVFFDRIPIFLTPEGTLNEKAGTAAWHKMATPPADDTRFEFLHGIDIIALEKKGRDTVLHPYPDETLWDEDVMLLNVAGVVFR